MIIIIALPAFLWYWDEWQLQCVPLPASATVIWLGTELIEQWEKLGDQVRKNENNLSALSDRERLEGYQGPYCASNIDNHNIMKSCQFSCLPQRLKVSTVGQSEYWYAVDTVLVWQLYGLKSQDIRCVWSFSIVVLYYSTSGSDERRCSSSQVMCWYVSLKSLHI